MATRSENTVTINQPLDKVQKAYASEDYWKFIAENLSPEPGEVAEFEPGKATLYEVLPLDLLPEAVRSMVSQALKVKRVVTVEGEKYSYTADVKGTPVNFSGEAEISGSNELTSLAYDNEVSVDIPFMGPAIEPKVGEALADLFQNEGNLTERWINENL
ncbi:DUF2505 domain-containing protein [Corynebacterium yudongzhengii]|uniref:DUF2505 domain-containing protein n=1 Tax=Corynebacterium yudongzhengii TaxID=2080740 RepID=A0A2U1T9I6_9CORY|nr:DUF2505 domain-containing protein [Corynebacterium yudongzhengii]AWB81141.1 DUF2505 domain-containing protein [Corynebacterium yudongzhengii]PWC02680.1 DUF2505 domain-containing protein [Corynebacterium yudongzhengii]